MTVNAKPTGRAVSAPVGLAIGCSISLGVTLIGAGVLAKLVDSETLAQEHMGYGIMVVLMIASWIGSLTSKGMIKRQKVLIGLLSGLLYFGVLLAITALFFGGQYNGVGETGLLILCGSVLGILAGSHEKSIKRRGKVKIRNR